MFYVIILGKYADMQKDHTVFLHDLFNESFINYCLLSISFSIASPMPLSLFERVT